MKKKALLGFVAIATAMVFVAAGCGNDTASETTSTSSTSTSTQEATSTASVNIQSLAFSPASTAVKAGGTVTFTNNDSTSHTATADDGSFDTGTLAPGQSKSVTVTKVGSVSFHCNFHSSMTGTINVQ